jgi:K+-transporting ATPase KdpF subunit
LPSGFSYCRDGSSRCWTDYEELTMTAMYLLGGIVSLGLLIYLMVALLKPEWF